MPGPHDRTVAFICGLHRSGTSLLHRCLAAHPDVSRMGGTGVPEDEGQHLQDVFPPASRFGGAGRFAFHDEARLDGSEWRPMPDDHRDRLWRQWGVQWDLQRQVLLEKSPPDLIRMPYLQDLADDTRFIVVTRHPVAVSLATQKWSHTGPDSLLRHWLRAHDMARADLDDVRRSVVVRYEDFTAAPLETLRDLWRFLGVEASKGTLEEEIDADVNARYFRTWQRRARRPIRGIPYRTAARRHAGAISRHGYDLADVAEA